MKNSLTRKQRHLSAKQKRLPESPLGAKDPASQNVKVRVKSPNRFLHCCAYGEATLQQFSLRLVNGTAPVTSNHNLTPNVIGQSFSVNGGKKPGKLKTIKYMHVHAA